MIYIERVSAQIRECDGEECYDEEGVERDRVRRACQFLGTEMSVEDFGNIGRSALPFPMMYEAKTLE